MPHDKTPALNISLKLSPRPPNLSDPPLQYSPPLHKELPFDESSICNYPTQIYTCCHSTYTTTVPPQVRHLPPCPYTYQPLRSNIQPKLICPTLHRTPIPVEILATCDPCIIEQCWGSRRADTHGINQVGLEREWVLAFKREGEGVKRERWVRVEGREGWREWMGKRRDSEGEYEVVVQFEGEEWIVVR